MLTRKLILVGVMFLIAAVSRAQVTIGNSITSRSILDTATTTFVLSGQPFGSGATGLNLTSWSFYAGSSGDHSSVGLSVTPLLLEYSGSGNTYVVRAIGETVTVGSLGANTNLTFNAVVGSTAITNSNFYFGWKDGSTTSANQGVISWSNTGSAQVKALAGNSSTNITAAGTSLDFGNTSLGARTYSVSATASAIPEPATTVALAAAAALGFAIFRRRR